MGFISGLFAGTLAALAALFLTQPSPAALAAAQGWISSNLGHSVWFFSTVLVIFLMQLLRLQRLLKQPADTVDPVEISRLDQLLDVWGQVFIGIGVIWTAIGMRGALQAALSDPASALTDTAGNVLRDLVDGGILLALSTTILGAIGGYAMRLMKTAAVGAELHSYYSSREQQEVSALLQATERIEARLSSTG